MKKRLTPLARDLRKHSTDAERKLWKYLRTKQMDGLKFRRQQPIGKYIVDFVCFEKKVVVELDGSHHYDQQEQDSERDAYLNESGFIVMRFWNNEVHKNIDGVCEAIRETCLAR